MSCFHTLVLKESPLAVGVNTQKSPLDVTVCTALGYLRCFLDYFCVTAGFPGPSSTWYQALCKQRPRAWAKVIPIIWECRAPGSRPA